MPFIQTPACRAQLSVSGADCLVRKNSPNDYNMRKWYG